ncbi:uncharacterized protein LOC126368511 [Pectinophora gossypiella]|uniref:uncharacterized protein LOC126368511 n=1 Tax=Pectinophora gossypiella TaxID=13191 RepID=UPI00214F07A9|nr:uncharacterized protein LOC126368511 [Pectinophora gossypiella]
MNDSLNSNMPEPKKVGVWAEGTHIEAKEFIIPKKSPDSSDDIPTIPDLDDLQDILEKEISSPPIPDRKDKETVSALAEVSGGISGSVEGIDAALEVLKSYIPIVEADVADTVWTVDTLLTQLAEENQDTDT